MEEWVWIRKTIQDYFEIESEFGIENLILVDKMAGIRSKDLLCLLQDFPAATLEGLYTSAPACLAVYRLACFSVVSIAHSKKAVR